MSTEEDQDIHNLGTLAPAELEFWMRIYIAAVGAGRGNRHARREAAQAVLDRAVVIGESSPPASSAGCSSSSCSPSPANVAILHGALDMLLAQYLLAFPCMTPSTTTVLELLKWNAGRMGK